MRTFKLVLPAVLLTGGFLVCTTASYGTQDYSKKEKKGCNFCHSKVLPADKEAMKGNLNDAGKYYQSHDHSLVGFTGDKK